MPKTLVVAYKEEDVARLLPFIRRRETDTVVLGFEPSAQESLKKEGTPYKTPEDYHPLNPEVYEKIVDRAYSIVREWYRDISPKYEGISLGSVIEQEFYAFLVMLIKNLETIRCVIDTEKPQELMVVETRDPYERVIFTLGRFMNIPTFTIKPDTFYEFRNRLKEIFIPYVLQYGPPIKHAISTLKNRFKVFESKGDKILAVSWGANLFQLLSLVKDLRKEGYDARFLILDLGAQRGLQKEGLPYVYLGDYLTQEGKKKAKKEITKLALKWQELKNNEEFRGFFNYDGIPLWSLLEDRLAEFFLSDFVRVIEDIEATKNIVRKEKPDLVLVPSDSLPKEKTIVLTCNLKNVPTLQILHGIMPVRPIGHLPISSSKMAVWGKASKEMLVNHGTPVDKLVITGRPRFDMLLGYKNKKEEVCRKLNIDPNRGIVVFATQPFVRMSGSFPKEREVFFYAVAKAMEEFPDKQLVVKLHPTEHDHEYRAIMKEKGFNVIIVRDINIYDLLSASDLVIEVDSTVGLEAMMLDKPVINISFSGHADVFGYAKNGVAIDVRDPKDILSAMNKIFEDRNTREELKKNRERFVYEQAYKMDGQATRRVINLIEKELGAV